MGATLKDVAKEAGVSVMTVSRVINNKEYIAEATRKKVLTALQKANYSPNINARNLVTKRTDFIGLIVPDISNPFFGDLVKAAEKIARSKGYSVIFGDTDGNISVEIEYIDAFRGRMCEAIILVAPRMPDEMIRELNKSVPLVLVDRNISDDDIVQVSLDNAEGAYSAVSHLLSLGHRKIGFIMGPQNVPNSHRRKIGYENALSAYNIDLDPTLVFQGDFIVQTGTEAFHYFNSMSDRPTAIFSSNDLMAFGFVMEAIQHDMRIPDDYSIVGFDDIFLSKIMAPPLTTVRYPIVEMGKQAISVLLDSLDTKESVHVKEHLTHELIIRKSTQALQK